MSSKQIINTGWRFTRNAEVNGSYKGCNDKDWQAVTLPHDWSVEYPFDQSHSSGTGYLPGGTAWYRKRFELPQDIAGKRVYITFGGVYNNSRVWCNSNYLGKRPYGYSSFTYDISQFVVPGENVISVKVSHEDLADSRWFTGSGIYRDVTLQIADPVHFAPRGDGIFAYTTAADTQSAQLAVQWALCTPADFNEAAEIEFLLLDASGNTAAAVKGAGACGKALLDVSAPLLWSVNAPNLYTLKSRAYVGGVLRDEESTIIGIRSIRFDSGKGFFLNGESLKMKGVCVHHDAGVLGAAVPKTVWQRRLAKLAAAGCNAIRTSHNPPDSVLLDLCDEMGFLVLDEAFDEWEGCKNKWWQGHNVYPPKLFGYADDYPQWHEADLTDMVKRDRNHPCVVLWSVGNEVDYPNDPYGHPDFESVVGNNDANKPAQERVYDPNRPNAQRLAAIARELSDIVKKSDTTRPTTAALAFPELANIIGYSDAVDVAGYNYKEQCYAEDHAKYPARVIMGSENGMAVDQWAAVRDNDYICSQFLWTGIDYMGEAHGWPIRCSGAGLLTTAGFEKPQYALRKALWLDAPTAALTTRRDKDAPLWCERFHWSYNAGETVYVSCYTNQTEGELFLNGKSLGKQSIAPHSSYCMVWEVPFESGELTVKCGAASDTLTTAGDAAKIVLTADSKILRANGLDFAQVEVCLQDANGAFLPKADALLQYSLTGDAVIMGIENGSIADVTPFPARTRALYEGRSIVYLRAGTTAGEITLTVRDKNGLQSTLTLIQE